MEKKLKRPRPIEALGHVAIIPLEVVVNTFLDGEHEAFGHPTNMTGETLKYRFESFKKALSIFEQRDNQ